MCDAVRDCSWASATWAHSGPRPSRPAGTVSAPSSCADGPLGDAVVLATAVGSWVPDVLLGVRIDLGAQPHRHPTVLAREMTTFDRVSGGRAVLAFTGPFTEATVEAATLCRAMWTDGVAVGTGPHYPVAGAINRPLPERPGGPPSRSI